MSTTTLTISVNPSMLTRNLSRKEMIDFILEADSDIAEMDFTLKLLRRLIESLEKDESREWIAEELGFRVKSPKK